MTICFLTLPVTLENISHIEMFEWKAPLVRTPPLGIPCVTHQEYLREGDQVRYYGQNTGLYTPTIIKYVHSCNG